MATIRGLSDLSKEKAKGLYYYEDKPKSHYSKKKPRKTKSIIATIKALDN
jgi:hypothetical protein